MGESLSAPRLSLYKSFSCMGKKVSSAQAGLEIISRDWIALPSLTPQQFNTCYATGLILAVFFGKEEHYLTEIFLYFFIPCVRTFKKVQLFLQLPHLIKINYDVSLWCSTYGQSMFNKPMINQWSINDVFLQNICLTGYYLIVWFVYYSLWITIIKKDWKLFSVH